MPSLSNTAEPVVLVFDLDDTLYLERDFAFSGFDAIDEFLQSRFGKQFVRQTCHRLFEAGVRGNIFDRALQQCGLDSGQEAIDELVKIYRSHQPVIALCADVQPFLAADSNKHAIITDGPAKTQRAKISALGIEHHFGLIVATDELPEGMGKPHRRAFEDVMEWSGSNGASHVYIADNPAKDFIAPRLLGWLTVQIDRPGKIHSSDPPSPNSAAQLRIESFDEISSLLSLGR